MSSGVVRDKLSPKFPFSTSTRKCPFVNWYSGQQTKEVSKVGAGHLYGNNNNTTAAAPAQSSSVYS